MIAEVFKSERAEFHYCSLGILWSVLLAPNGNCFASILVFHLFFCFSHWCNIHVQPRGGWHFFFLSLLLISLVLFLFLLPFCGCFFFLLLLQEFMTQIVHIFHILVYVPVFQNSDDSMMSLFDALCWVFQLVCNSTLYLWLDYIYFTSAESIQVSIDFNYICIVWIEPL